MPGPETPALSICPRSIRVAQACFRRAVSSRRGDRRRSDDASVRRLRLTGRRRRSFGRWRERRAFAVHRRRIAIAGRRRRINRSAGHGRRPRRQLRFAWHGLLRRQRLFWRRVLRVGHLHDPGRCLFRPGRRPLQRGLVRKLRWPRATLLPDRHGRWRVHRGRDRVPRRHVRPMRRPRIPLLQRRGRRKRVPRLRHRVRQQPVRRVRNARWRVLPRQPLLGRGLLLRRQVRRRVDRLRGHRRCLSGGPVFRLRQRRPAVLRRHVLRRPDVQERHMRPLRRPGRSLLRQRRVQRGLLLGRAVPGGQLWRT